MLRRFGLDEEVQGKVTDGGDVNRRFRASFPLLSPLPSSHLHAPGDHAVFSRNYRVRLDSVLRYALKISKHRGGQKKWGVAAL